MQAKCIHRVHFLSNAKQKKKKNTDGTRKFEMNSIPKYDEKKWKQKFTHKLQRDTDISVAQTLDLISFYF